MNISSTIGSRQRIFPVRRVAQKERYPMLPAVMPQVAPNFSPREVTVEELQQQLESPTPPRLAEILGPRYFAQGHLPGAVNLPLEGFAENALRVLPDRDADVVVYCASATCENSEIAERKLKSLGYTRVRVFKGGKAAWRDAGLPLTV